MKLRANSVVLLSLAILLMTFPASAEEGIAQGIQVHGHWNLQVRDPDGTLVSETNFENHYEPSSLLANLMSGLWSAGIWQVELDRDAQNPGTNNLCGGGTEGCEISQTGALTVTVTPTGEIILSGSTTVTNAGTINDVSTWKGQCGSLLSPESCGSSGTSATLILFTRHSLPASPPPPSAVAGQIVQVKVTLSFS